MNEFDEILERLQEECKPKDFGIDKDSWADVRMDEVEDAWDDIEEYFAVQ